MATSVLERDGTSSTVRDPLAGVAATSEVSTSLFGLDWSGPFSEGVGRLEPTFQGATSSSYEVWESFRALTRLAPSAAPGTRERTQRTSHGVDNVAGSIRELRDISALTADQIGRIFGVTRRSVQNWMAGASMASRHEERLADVLERIRRLGSTPAERRRALLRSAEGPSPFQRLLDEVASGQRIQWPGYTARELLKA